MPQKWRWDQGRLEYFNFDNLKRIASVLVQLENINLDVAEYDPIRAPLEQQTGLPFLPIHYKVWRNYARIFRWTLLAARKAGLLTATDICRKLADSPDRVWDIDEYLSYIIPRVYYPSPATQSYNRTDVQIFPFCVLLKYLLASYSRRGETVIGIDTIFSYLVGNGCIGTEPIDSYTQLQPTGYQPRGDEVRQLRELLIFISQSSFLKWHNNMLHLDIMRGDEVTAKQVESIAIPIIRIRKDTPDLEVIQLGGIQAAQVEPVASVAREMQSDLPFTEGKRVRVTHLRVERSPQLRRLFFASLEPPFLCDMCGCDTKTRYPWTDNLLEVHHLLPLPSVIKMSVQGTLFEDIVPLCPSCHRGVHTYYRIWLKNHNQDDFVDKEQVRLVYHEIKSMIHLV